MRKLLALASIVFVGGLIVAGLYYGGSPGAARKQREDLRTLESLDQLRHFINDEMRVRGELPKDLGAPWIERIKNFEWRTLDQNKYELCAQFNLDSDELNGDFLYYREDRGFTDYKAGRVCKEFTVDSPRFRDEIPGPPNVRFD